MRQAAQRIKVWSDTMVADPRGRAGEVRLIPAAVVRGYKRLFLLQREGRGELCVTLARSGGRPDDGGRDCGPPLYYATRGRIVPYV